MGFLQSHGIECKQPEVPFPRLDVERTISKLVQKEVQQARPHAAVLLAALGAVAAAVLAAAAVLVARGGR